MSDLRNAPLLCGLSAVFASGVVTAVFTPSRAVLATSTRGSDVVRPRQIAQATATPTPIPAPTFSFGADTDAGIDAWVNANDEQLSVNVKSNSPLGYRLWVGGIILDSNGMSHPGSTGLLFASPLPTVSPEAGIAQPIFGPVSNPAPDPGFDLNYSAPGSVIHLYASSDDVTNFVMFYEGENWFFCQFYDSLHCTSTGGSPFWGSIGYATSTNGIMWTNTARVIDAPTSKPTSPAGLSGGYGTFVPSAVIASGYVYVFFANGLQNGSPVTIHVARAPTPAPMDTSAPSFIKFYKAPGHDHGVFGDEPGLEGKGTGRESYR